MGLFLHRSWRGPGGTRITASNGGLSASKRIGPLTITSRGHVTLRILPGLTWRIR